ncbi:MAG TPA: FAD-dependent oxidoreductase [Ktedonobacterales bacterium]|nr:FAD-dependent oxidoreductase [Ktedonobacterales bacterium]
MGPLGTSLRPLRIAVIGAGPSGCYAIEALLKHAEHTMAIDLFDRFPTPYGLVRYGVAPDHPSIKAVTRVFEKVLADPRVHFYGHVTYGVDLHHAELKQWYDQIVYAVGAEADRRMRIPGEDLPNSMAATAFVGWYNGHPHYRELPVDLSCERAVVVGNGNVAIDVARILVTSPEDLARTDIANHALEQLRSSCIREVVLLGRRGPVQAAFTPAELRELGKLRGVDLVVDPQALNLDPASAAALEKDREAAQNLESLYAYATRTECRAPRRIIMRFLASPVELTADQGKLTAVIIEQNTLVPAVDGTLKARGTGKQETIQAGLVVRSIGYRSIPIEDVPFDEARQTLSNVAGRIVHPATGDPIPGEYVVGWAKRGPTGLIGNNKPDALATVESMLTDLPTLQGITDGRRDPDQMERFLRSRNCAPITYADWQRLDQYERALGARQGRPRVKVTTVPEMLAIICQAAHS